MSNVSSLDDWKARKCRAELAPVTVSAYGFSLGQGFVAWPVVAEIWCYRRGADAAADTGLEFTAAGMRTVISTAQPGFAALEAAMIGVFPDTRDWRVVLAQHGAGEARALLFQRG